MNTFSTKTEKALCSLACFGNAELKETVLTFHKVFFNENFIFYHLKTCFQNVLFLICNFASSRNFDVHIRFNLDKNLARHLKRIDRFITD